MRPPYWSPAVELSDFEFEVIRSRRGTVAILAYILGTFEIAGIRMGVFYGWGDGKQYRFHSHELYVSMLHRRKGVASAMNRYLFEHCNVGVITTDHGTDEGAEWMKASGYTHNHEAKSWYLTREKWGQMNR